MESDPARGTSSRLPGAAGSGDRNAGKPTVMKP